jgi:hypothetical protein
MKYIIPENKLYRAIYNYIDSKFSNEEINWTYGIDYDPEGDEDIEDENFIYFYYGEWGGEDYTDILFWYYSKEYYEGEPNSEVWMEDAPILSVSTDDYWSMDGLFGEYWKEPMKEWFENKFNLPVTTVTDDQ